MSVCELFKALDLAARRGDVAVLVKVFDGQKSYVDVVVDGRPMLDLLTSDVLEAVRGLGKLGERARLRAGGAEIYAEVVLLRPSVIVAGSGEVARRVSEIAVAMGYNVAALGHKAAGAAYSGEFSDLERLVSEGSVVIVANEGGSPRDVDAAEIALRRGAGYVAVLASKKRAALIIKELMQRGIPKEELERRLRSPAGLDIGAKTAGEIALSIMAEVVAYLRGGTGRPLSEIKNPYDALAEVEGEDLSGYKCEWRPPRLA